MDFNKNNQPGSQEPIRLVFDEPLNLTTGMFLSNIVNKHLKIIQNTSMCNITPLSLHYFSPLATCSCLHQIQISDMFLHSLPSVSSAWWYHHYEQWCFKGLIHSKISTKEEKSSIFFIYIKCKFMSLLHFIFLVE